MNNIAKWIYYRYFRKYRIVRSIVMMVKQGKWRIQHGTTRPSWRYVGMRRIEPRIAVICDNLTWLNFCTEVDAVYLFPDNWHELMEKYQPDVFFCEATWHGLNHNWEGRIFHDQTLMTDNRFILKDILGYCKKAQIPTVFWNKEDTPAFEDAPYSFIDTALLFDHIFTTAIECIPRYREKGHNSVYLMMFGFSEKLFSFRPPVENQTAVFLGSWYASQLQRCEEMTKMFDWILSLGMNLEIYDRMSADCEADKQYPEKYKPYLHKGVPYDKTGEVMGKASYVININTVKDSKTMFARRVFEAMACGRVVISNESIGMRELFPGHVWFINEKFPLEEREKIIEENLQMVKREFTFKKQLFSAMKKAHIMKEY